MFSHCTNSYAGGGTNTLIQENTSIKPEISILNVGNANRKYIRNEEEHLISQGLSVELQDGDSIEVISKVFVTCATTPSTLYMCSYNCCQHKMGVHCMLFSSGKQGQARREELRSTWYDVVGLPSLLELIGFFRTLSRLKTLRRRHTSPGFHIYPNTRYRCLSHIESDYC